MQPIYIFLIVFAVLWFLVYVLGRLLKLDEKLGWSFGPLFLLIRTKRFNEILKKIAKKYARFWRLIGNISIFVGFILMFISIGLLMYTLVDFFRPAPVISGSGPAIGLIIPGVTVSFKTLLYLIIPLILTLVPHEFAHGVVSHADGVELKSTGLAFLAFFFGAFVEPDDEELFKSSYVTKMRTFASGIFPNVLLGIIALPIFLNSYAIVTPLYGPPNGVLVFEVVDDSPAITVGLERGVVIYDINQTHLTTVANFSNYMSQTGPNQLVQLNTSIGLLDTILDNNPSNETKGYLGITVLQYQPPKTKVFGPFFPYMFFNQMMWIVVVAFGSVLFNVLPIPFLLDGDKLLSSFLLKYVKNKKVGMIILSILRFLALVLFLANLILPMIKFGLVPIG
ncbi:MAG: site-2 protease family protein [Candidatus Thorarchaeota archaeon]